MSRWFFFCRSWVHNYFNFVLTNIYPVSVWTFKTQKDAQEKIILYNEVQTCFSLLTSIKQAEQLHMQKHTLLLYQLRLLPFKVE